jgi:hypothetical protein
MRVKECPKCGEDVSHTYQEYDPDVGIMSGGWYCEACELPIDEEAEQDYNEP